MHELNEATDQVTKVKHVELLSHLVPDRKGSL